MMAKCIDCGKETENPKARCCVQCAVKRMIKRDPKIADQMREQEEILDAIARQARC